MTGAQHYAEAERLVQAGRQANLTEAGPVLAAAQVHATLALAAATVQPAVDIDGQSADRWAEVTA